MSSETGFALLIARDIRRSMSSGKPNRHWRLVYAAAAVLALAVVATYESTQHTMVLSSITPVWTISFYIPIISFGFPMALVMNEWRQNTVGWWLTLPLPRFQLAAAKCLAGVGKAARVTLWTFLGISVLGIYASIVSTHRLDISSSLAFLAAGLRWNLFLLCLCPFTSSLGLVFGTMRQSRWRPALPIAWAACAIGWSIGNKGGKNWNTKNLLGLGHGMITSEALLHVAIAIVASWLLAVLFIWFAAYLLERQTNL